MSTVSITDLLNLSFEDCDDRIKHLHVLLKILVTQLKLDDVQVDFDYQNFMPSKCVLEKTKECQLSSAEDLEELTKRLEALKDQEIEHVPSSVSKVSSIQTAEDIKSKKGNSSESSSSKFTEFEAEKLLKKQIDEKLSSLNQNICDLQKKAIEFQEQIDDLMFASEQIDIKADETINDINDYNSKIFCLKSDVKTLVKDSKEFKEKFVSIAEMHEVMNNVKTNKSYVDELLRQKAFASDLEKFVPRDDFDTITDVLCLKFSLMEENFSKLKENLKNTLACFKSEIDEKLEKSELKKFKDTMSTLFDDFVNALKILLFPLMNAPGVNHSCDKEPSIPKLDSVANRFKSKMDKINVQPSRISNRYNGDMRRLLSEDKRPASVGVNCFKKEYLRNDNSQPCFIISQDNSIIKADPMKCLNNPKYIKS